MQPNATLHSKMQSSEQRIASLEKLGFAGDPADQELSVPIPALV